MLLVVASLAILLGITTPVYYNFSSRNDLDNAATLSTLALRTAHQRARGVEHDDAWGVYATTSAIYIYKGTDFLARDPLYDERIDISGAVQISGTDNFVFEKFTGIPVTSGMLVLESGTEGARSIAVNAAGTVSY